MQIMKFFQNIASILNHLQVNLEQYKWFKRWDVISRLLYVNVKKIGRFIQRLKEVSDSIFPRQKHYNDICAQLQILVVLVFIYILSVNTHNIQEILDKGSGNSLYLYYYSQKSHKS